jgi:hypothetical protein
MTSKELDELGAQWIDSADGDANRYRFGGTSNAYVTRLHVRYDAKSFPEDLNFIETRDRENFQGRYVVRHPSVAKTSCPAGVPSHTNRISANKKRPSSRN